MALLLSSTATPPFSPLPLPQETFGRFLLDIKLNQSPKRWLFLVNTLLAGKPVFGVPRDSVAPDTLINCRVNIRTLGNGEMNMSRD